MAPEVLLCTTTAHVRPVFGQGHSRDAPLRRGRTRGKFPIQSGEELEVYPLILRCRHSREFASRKNIDQIEFGEDRLHTVVVIHDDRDFTPLKNPR